MSGMGMEFCFPVGVVAPVGVGDNIKSGTFAEVVRECERDAERERGLVRSMPSIGIPSVVAEGDWELGEAGTLKVELEEGEGNLTGVSQI